jgi:serine-type D-Ala-D-Ala carboxypeptidase/endopeptidase
MGQYEYAPGTVDTVTGDGDQLIAQTSGQEKEQLLPENETTFFVKGQDYRIIFVKDSNGIVRGLLFRQNGQDFPAKKLK